jgi:hypothetical protein
MGLAAEGVLELFLYGGLGPFESFYVVEDYGRSDDPNYPSEQWHLFASRRDQQMEACGQSPADYLQPFGTDALGVEVSLGPLVQALKDRPDLIDRMRLIVQRHDLEPHEAAIPYALSGSRLGSARMAGLGAHIQRHWQERAPRPIPHSYVMYPSAEISTDNLRAASAVGFHPGSSRPLALRIQSNSQLPAQLRREAVGSARAEVDALLRYYEAQSRDRYRIEGKALRSRALQDYAAALDTLGEGESLSALFSEEALQTVSGESCGDSMQASNPAMGLQLATHLLTHPEAAARYVCMVDGGLIPASGGGGYDVHTDHLGTTSRNLHHTLSELVARINLPGEGDPAKLDLDRTLVLLNTEFGRTPYLQAGSRNGTNHHPYGYVTVMIGGPIRPGGSGIVGAIGPDAWADRYVTPAEARCAALVAAGIWPFAQESFAIGDLRVGGEEANGVHWLREVVLGVPL